MDHVHLPSSLTEAFDSRKLRPRDWSDLPGVKQKIDEREHVFFDELVFFFLQRSGEHCDACEAFFSEAMAQKTELGYHQNPLR